MGSLRRIWLVRPKIRRQTAKFIAQGERPFGIVDGRTNFAAVAHDARIEQKPSNVGLIKPGHQISVEICECSAKHVTFVQDREPRQTRLKALEANFLEKSSVIKHRGAPFTVVIALINS